MSAPTTSTPSTQTLQFHTLDVFTQTRYAGNQLAVILLPPTTSISQAQKQSIAQEFNLSETIFVHVPPSLVLDSSCSASVNDLEVVVDIFTTHSELPFAGHPTIGAIYFILTHLAPTTDTVRVQLKAGVVHGTLDRDTGFASARIPQNVRVHQQFLTWERVRAVQTSLPEEWHGASAFPIVSVVRGMNFALVDVGGAGVLDAVRVTPTDVAGWEDLDDGWREGLIGTVFYTMLEKKGEVCRVDQRVVVMGLEDPATGSATSALCAWLALQRKQNMQFEVTQGVKMGRPSVIGVVVTLDQTGTKVEKIVLSGPSREVMKGELVI